MSLLQEWRDEAYSQERNQNLWDRYFEIEKGIYSQLLTEPVVKVEGTVKELADKYNTEIKIFVGFLDGINESLKEPNPIDTMEESTYVCIDIDLEKLFYNMVAAKADWLYELKEWESLISSDRRKELYKEQKSSSTIVKGEKVGRNDKCPCNSGKKYKKCCGM